MAFKVRFSGQPQPQDYGDEETWAEFHPPAKWDQVTAEPDHLAGLNTPYVDDEDEDYDEDEDDEEFEDEDYGDDGDEEYEDD